MGLSLNIVARAFKQCPPRLIDYFRSGWAFFIPYLAAYLLYAWLKWPVNPASRGGGIAKEISESGATLTPSPPLSLTPCLLHVYWFIHIIHFMLAAFALVIWWQGKTKDQEPRIKGSTSVFQFFSTSVLRVAPWLLLALVFYIPGIYLELPADPWAHFIRTNEWASVQQVTQHSTWFKFSYFLAYTVANGSGGVSSLVSQLARLEFFYAGCCLLLCWQYYRLGRAVGLGERGAMCFVLIQVLISGNNLFGFYRYYGISSSLLGQLGAVATVRLVLEVLHSSAAKTSNEQRYDRQRFTALSFPISGLLLLAFTGINHGQGVAIAGLGIAAAALSRWSRWRTTVRWGILIAIVVTSASMVVWWPRQPALDDLYRPEKWLTFFYGFNLLPGSPAFDRTVAILGWAGVANLLAAGLLLRRQPAVALLTLVPVAVLITPATAIPLANVLSQHNDDPANILTFHRLLFAIPPGLALVALGTVWCERARISAANNPGQAHWLLPTAIAASALLFLTLAPASAPGFNRFYHMTAKVPQDLGIEPSLHILDELASLPFSQLNAPETIAISELAYAKRTTEAGTPGRFQLISYTSATQSETIDIVAFLHHWPMSRFVPLTGREFYSPRSTIGYLSKHWMPQKAAVSAMGGAEFEQQAGALGYKRSVWQGLIIYTISQFPPFLPPESAPQGVRLIGGPDAPPNGE